MVGKCGGLPLAIITLRGLLAKKRRLKEWERMCRNINSYLRSGKGDGEENGLISEKLALSYYDLPYQLKPCFLYLGLFPKDTEVSTKKLIRMWVAEGIVTSMNEEKVEDIAERYLGELIDRCMVEVGARSLTGRVKTCRLHDLMRDLCLLKAKEQSFLQVTSATKLRLSDLCHLETLSLLDARKSNVKELVKLTSLRKLEIVSLECFEELEVIFNSPSPILNNLRSLSVEILDDRVEEGNLTQFLQACHNDFYRLSNRWCTKQVTRSQQIHAKTYPS
ncbi:putative disease resistance protein [Vitis vinifera]|uniref:Putative disease resistance protein n=1 Tax=Vitis vinifera TaxID=29760 RepID=A0A438H7K1_VITVI|nr:putative disease resistance protein [Vitis vinifera]